MTSLVAIVPVLARPHRVRPTLESFAASIPEGVDARLLFVADVTGDDDELDEIARHAPVGCDFRLVPPNRTYAQKVNAGVCASTEDLILTAADDLVFHPGWLDACLREVASGASVIGTNDLGNRFTIDGRHSTHTLVTREYVDRVGATWDDGPGVLLHEGYRHECCDNELCEVAMVRGVWAHAADAVIEHLHPVWGKAHEDPTYERGRAMGTVDRAYFQRRRRTWLPEPGWYPGKE